MKLDIPNVEWAAHTDANWYDMSTTAERQAARKIALKDWYKRREGWNRDREINDQVKDNHSPMPYSED